MTEFIDRFLNLNDLVRKKSYFLLGPRQTGKSMLIREQLPAHKSYNLLKSDVFTTLSHSPQTIREQLSPDDKVIIIDEIQKLPLLLDEVHLMIEEHNIIFLLTGSSARSLKRKGVNLLAGRARSIKFHPFVYSELGDRFDLNRAVNYGLLPSVYFSDDPGLDLRAYAGEYLQEEIASEAVVRNISAFSRFLEVAAMCNGQMINFSQLANDAQVPVSTLREYFEILKDTMIAHELPAFKCTKKRKAISKSKYYFFDNGVVRSIQKRRELAAGTPEFGHAFECYLFHEIKTYCDYHQIEDLSYWRSKSQFEVDFILDNKLAIVVKAKKHITSRDLKGIKALKEEGLLERYVVVTMQEQKSMIDDIEIVPWREFLTSLWRI